MSGNSIIQLQVIPPAEYVYALRRVSDQRIKIGHTTDLFRRLRGLTEYGEFDVIGIRYGTEADENVVRDALRLYRIPPKHDWFYASAEVFLYIQENFAAHASIRGIRNYDGGNYHITPRRCNCGYDFCLFDRDGCYECVKDALPKRKKKQQQVIKYLSKFDYWLAEMQAHSTPAMHTAATARPSATANSSATSAEGQAA